MEASGTQRKRPDEGSQACAHSINNFSYCCCFYLLFCLCTYYQNLEAPLERERANGNKNREKNNEQRTTRKGKNYRIENPEMGNWKGAWSRETLTPPATSWRLTEKQGDAAQWCSSSSCGRMTEWMDTGSQQGQAPEEIDEEDQPAWWCRRPSASTSMAPWSGLS